jgi:predicted XRE-type DNA-binding protein
MKVFNDLAETPGVEMRGALRALLRHFLGLRARKLTVRAAETLTGIAAAEFSRIRNVKLERFTLDRMIKILGKLDEDVEVTVSFHSRQHGAHDAPHAR